MSDPTIDEMLDWVSFVDKEVYEVESGEAQAIRAILEQHRDAVPEICASCQGEVSHFQKQIEREAIRAFVERVEKRLPDYNTGKGADSWLKAYRLAAYDELAAMEQETKEKSE